MQRKKPGIVQVKTKNCNEKEPKFYLKEVILNQN
jgi:hypothetical protein